MILAVDLGNTQIKFGIFKERELVHTHTCAPNNNIEKNIKLLKKFNITLSVISSVVPPLTILYQKAISKYLELNPLIINHKNCNINLIVDQPETVGADRICNAVAASVLYETSAIIVDFGTATTYDVINNKGDFIGGVIAPGVETSANYLIKKAALLSKTDLKFPKKIIGTNTKNNIQSGVMFGSIDQVTGMIQRINNELAINHKIILTGGFSKLISPYLTINHFLDMNLTLRGIVFISETNI